MDGNLAEWEGIPPITGGFISSNPNVERLSFAADNENLYILIVPRSHLPAMEYLVQINTIRPGQQDVGYSLHTYPWYSFFARDDMDPFTQGIRNYDIAYGQVTEIRLPLSELGYPTRVEFNSFRTGLDWTQFKDFCNCSISLPMLTTLPTMTPFPTLTLMPEPTLTLAPQLTKPSVPTPVDQKPAAPIWLIGSGIGILLVIVVGTFFLRNRLLRRASRRE